MCGRYLVMTDDDYEEIKNVISEVSGKLKDTNLVNGEVFPTNNIPVVYSHKGKNILSAAKWGFPSFQKQGVIINARAESLAAKPMFKDSFISKRCIVPANGYYEWLTHTDKKKTKYLISVKEKRLFYMAGLYSMFTDKSGIAYAATTIITTEANADIAFIHDRMPAILRAESINEWLDKNNTNPITLQSLLTPYKAGEIKFEAA